MFDPSSIPSRNALVGRTPTKDGTPPEPRKFHRWTLDKLEVLRLYLSQYRKVAGGGSYIDAFAGTGTALIGDKEKPGSPRIALKSEAFKRLYLFEQDDQAALLRKEVERVYGDAKRAKCRYLPGDCNAEIPKLLASGEIPRDKPCFAFLDPNSTELGWDTVVALSEYKTVDLDRSPPLCKVEMWILLNTGQALGRMWPKDRSKFTMPLGAKTFDSMFGDRDAWFDLWRDGLPFVHLALRYADRLRGLGYGSVTAYELREPGTNQLQYHMLHATDHAAAVDFMAWAQQTPTADVPKQPKLKFDAGRTTRTSASP